LDSTGALEHRHYLRLFQSLLLMGHAFLEPTVDLLELTVQRSVELSLEEVRTVFASLANAQSTRNAADLFVGCVKRVALADVSLRTVTEITTIAATAMLLRWPMNTVVSAIGAAAAAALRLMPVTFVELERALGLFRGAQT
jgi:hypothetical protein